MLMAMKVCLAQNPDSDKVIRIPVIFHVVYSDRAHARNDGGNTKENLSDSILIRELADLNRDFLLLNKDTAEVIPPYKGIIGNARIEFYLADTTLQVNEKKGIIRMKTNRNKKRLYNRSSIINHDKYLNVYIGAIQGSFAPSATPWMLPDKDAVYLGFDWVGQGYRLLTHETGHWLGLLHIYGGNGGAKGNNESCTIGDDIEDTPAQSEATELDGACVACPPPIGTLKDKACNASMPSNFNNYMDYSGCRRMFTKGQVARMRGNIRKHRAQIWTNSITR